MSAGVENKGEMGDRERRSDVTRRSVIPRPHGGRVALVAWPRTHGRGVPTIRDVGQPEVRMTFVEPAQG